MRKSISREAAISIFVLGLILGASVAPVAAQLPALPNEMIQILRDISGSLRIIADKMPG